MSNKEIKQKLEDELAIEIENAIVTTGKVADVAYADGTKVHPQNVREVMANASTLAASAKRMEVLAWKIGVVNVALGHGTYENLFFD